jgi:two-component system LytT family sensor kinase
MEKKLLPLLLGFIIFYYIVHAAYNLPDLVHGNARFALLPTGASPLALRLADIAAGFLFVLCPYLILYRFYTPGKMLTCITFIVLSLIVVFFINYWLRKIAAPPQTFRLRNFFSDNLFFFCVYIVYGVVFYFVRFSYYKELQQKELMLQNRQSELSFLRSQVNPHFLFNSLNNIYALVYENSTQALPAISGLSELLRYMLYDNTEKVPLEKELGYIHKYIDLQKLRFEHTIKAEVQVSGPVEKVQVPPLLLIPFIENAFKHGDFSSGGQGLTVTVHCSAAKMTLYCYNTKGTGKKDTGGGIGLANIKRRLALLYPGKHTLDIQDTQNSFTINLELQHAG